ncbi:MAG: 23S rRNA (guanosine(2251)-2'-O)-methyltransferase RlmB, partial [Gammaproteobacteria bacterium]|nr:23S rRNA (guanosine(2251)-2'-O)-methyltransferase RlmB [Gammaproteobacteria bacterium]
MSRNQLIYGIHAVLGALRANPGNVLELWMDQRRQDARMRAIVNAAQQLGLKVQAVQGKTLQRLVGEAGHQGVVVRYRLGRDLAENDLLKILDGIDIPALLLV